MVSDLLGVAVSKEKFKRAARLRDAKDWILRERCVLVFMYLRTLGLRISGLRIYVFCDVESKPTASRLAADCVVFSFGTLLYIRSSVYISTAVGGRAGGVNKFTPTPGGRNPKALLSCRHRVRSVQL